MSAAPRVFLLAGEHSGDALGGPLMAALKVARPDVVFDGVGGLLMAAQGLESFLPMEALCVMGLVEVVKHYPRLRRLGFRIIEHIEATQPDIVVSIDLPDFNFVVAKLLKKRGVFKGKIVHYVAPSVWAWRPGRARKIAKFLDGVMCLFPFEPDYFTVHGLDAAFVGHSMVESGMLAADGAAFRARHGIAADVRTVGVLFGSRVREVEMIGEIWRDVMARFPDVHFIVPTLPKLRGRVEACLVGNYTVVTDEKAAAFAACDGAMAVSGTVALELAYMGVPHVMGYRMHWLSAFVARMLIKTKFAHLANILLARAVVPEFLQGDCTADNIAGALQDLSVQKDGLAEVRALLEGSDGQPSQKAATFICSQLA